MIHLSAILRTDPYPGSPEQCHALCINSAGPTGPPSYLPSPVESTSDRSKTDMDKPYRIRKVDGMWNFYYLNPNGYVLAHQYYSFRAAHRDRKEQIHVQ